MKDNALYLEADEDITSAIDKLGKSEGSSVQIVVPKRSTMLQSIINLKLLKKAAENSGKELVLVTNDRIANDLAGRVGLAVAPSLGAKPVLSEAKMPEDLKSNEEVIEADDPEPPRPEPAPKPEKPKRALLKRRAVSDESPTPPASAAAAAAGGSASDAPSDAPPAASGPKKPGLKVPSFQRLQRRLMWVALGLILVAGYWGAMFFMAKATVTLYANGTKVDIDTTFTVDPTTKTTDKDKGVLAGQTVSVTKDLSGSFTPTGKKDVGTKAGGTMTIYNCNDAESHPLQTGTRLVAPDGKVFRTTSDVVVTGATIGSSSICPNGGGFIKPGSVSVMVTADQNGDSYNEGPAKYTIMAYSTDLQKTIFGQGAQMSGGTSKTVTVVTQADVDTAKAELLAKDKDNIERELDGRLPDGYVALEPSQATTTAEVSPSPAVDAEGTGGTLSLKVTYAVLAVKQSEYQELIRSQELKQIGDKNQIYNDGIESAQITASEKESNGRQSFHLTTEAYGGAKIDTAALATQIKGKRYGDAVSLTSRLPGVSKAEIHLSPSWSTHVPSRTDKIKVVIQVAGAK